MSRRGDVVMVRFPYYDRPGAKDRPADAIIATLGYLSDPLKQKLDECLKAALELP